MTPTEMSSDFSVSPQIAVEDVAGIAARGYRSIICNRPDHESPGQPEAEAIRAEAERHGLGFAFVPVISGGIVPPNVEAFRAAMAELPGPVLAYCRSGTRCRNLWLLANGG